MKTRIALIGVVAFAFQLCAGVPSFPAQTGHRINLFGNNSASPKQGIDGRLRLATGFADSGHAVISQNAPASRAYYYIAGAAHASWPADSTEAAVGTSLTGLPTTSAYLTGKGWDATGFSFRAGQAGGDPDKTWNLGGDVLNTDWFASGASTTEERIYAAAAPADVDSLLDFNGTPILSFGYSPLFMILDYGTGPGGSDTIKAFSNPVAATKQAGLSGDLGGLADALLEDIAANGGSVQLRFDTIQAATRADYDEAGFRHGLFAFGGAIQMVSGTPVVPTLTEWGVAVLLLVLAGGSVLGARRQSAVTVPVE